MNAIRQSRKPVPAGSAFWLVGLGGLLLAAPAALGQPVPMPVQVPAQTRAPQQAPEQGPEVAPLPAGAPAGDSDREVQERFPGRGPSREYLQARRALEAEEWERARHLFERLAERRDSEADAALYWLAYVQAQSGRVTDALAAIDELMQRYPRGNYVDDAVSLRLELEPALAEAIGRAMPPTPPPLPPRPPVVAPGLSGGERLDPDAELELLALEGLMRTNPDRALRYLEELFGADRSPAAKRRALFLLGHSGHPQAREIIADLVRSGTDPQLRAEALRMMGVALDGDAAAAAIEEIYDELQSPALRRSALEALVLAEAPETLVALARREPAPELRAQIMRHLGMLEAADALRTLYAGESSPLVRAAMLDGFMLAGDVGMLLEVARGDDTALATRAMQGIAVTARGEVPADELMALYRGSADAGFRDATARTLAMHGEAAALLALYRESEDAGEKTRLVAMLRMASGEEAEEVFVEILEAARDP